jgi:hypothetical protein
VDRGAKVSARGGSLSGRFAANRPLAAPIPQTLWDNRGGCTRTRTWDPLIKSLTFLVSEQFFAFPTARSLQLSSRILLRDASAGLISGDT